MVSSRRLGGVLAVLVVAAGCAPSIGETMLPLPPPPGWRTRLELERAARRAFLREHPESPVPAARRGDFPGPQFWPPDPAWRFVGPLHLYPERQRFEIPTTSGKLRPCERFGFVRFRLGGEDYTLTVYRLLDGEGGLFLPFMDATTGRETYAAGRYVELIGTSHGYYELDFNRAYNPSCAYGDPQRFACPVTPSENRLPVAIEAGERGYLREGRPVG